MRSTDAVTAATPRDLSELFAARDAARAADRLFQDIAFDVLSIGRQVPYTLDGVVRTGRIAEHGTKGEWWRWTMVWVRDDDSGRKVRVDVIDIINAVSRTAPPSS